MNRKLIRRQFYAEDDEAVRSSQKDRQSPSQYQKMIDQNSQQEDAQLEYE